VSVRSPNRPLSRTRFRPDRPRTDFLPATPQLGLGPCTTKTTLAGALSRKVTTVPRRFFGPRVEKRCRETRTVPVVPLNVVELPWLVPPVEPDGEPLLCPLLPPAPEPEPEP